MSRHDSINCESIDYLSDLCDVAESGLRFFCSACDSSSHPQGENFQNVTTVSAVTWGAFPNSEIKQPTIVDPEIFLRFWKVRADWVYELKNEIHSLCWLRFVQCLWDFCIVWYCMIALISSSHVARMRLSLCGNRSGVCSTKKSHLPASWLSRLWTRISWSTSWTTILPSQTTFLRSSD